MQQDHDILAAAGQLIGRIGPPDGNVETEASNAEASADALQANALSHSPELASAASSHRNQSDALLLSGQWRRCSSLELSVGNGGEAGDGLCPSLEHDLYEVIPFKRDGNCLFGCLLAILQERAPEALPSDIASLRGIIADCFEENDNDLRDYDGVSFQCESINAIRTGADATGHLHFGSISEVFAFSKLYGISISVHCPETTNQTVNFEFGSPPELLLQTLGWEKEERKKGSDHWQRLRQRQLQPLLSADVSSLGPSVLPPPQAVRTTHCKLDNPRNFPLPRSDTVILRGRVSLEENKKSVKQRSMQLSISTNRDLIEIAYDDRDDMPSSSNNFGKIVKVPGLILSSSSGRSGAAQKPTVSLTKNGRGEFKFCLRIDVPKSTDPALKLVMCFKTAEERSYWLDAFLWAENRANILRQHDAYVLDDQEAAVNTVETARAVSRSNLGGFDEVATNDSSAHDDISLEPTDAFHDERAIAKVEEVLRKRDEDYEESLPKSRDLTAFTHHDKKLLLISGTMPNILRSIPIQVFETPLSQTVLDQMVSLSHSSIRRTLGHFTDVEGLFPVLEHAVVSSVNALWLSPTDFVRVSMFSRCRWIASISQAISFLHASKIPHEPFDLDKSIAFFNDSNCKLLVVPCIGNLTFEDDRKFLVSFAEKVIISHPDRASAVYSGMSVNTSLIEGSLVSSLDTCMRLLRNGISDSGRMVGGVPVSSYNSEFDVVMNDALDHRHDTLIIAQSWIRICQEMSGAQFSSSTSIQDVISLFTWQEYLHRQSMPFQVDDEDRYRRRATANDPNRFIFTSSEVESDSDAPIFNVFSDRRTSLATKIEVLGLLLSFVQSIPENRSLYLEAGFFNHFKECMSSLGRRQLDDQVRELCLLILSHVLVSPIFFMSSWTSADEQKLAEEVCKVVCETLSRAVSAEVQHIALTCLQKFSSLPAYHSLIFDSPCMRDVFVLCLKCTTLNLEPSQYSLSLHISELSCQILTILYLGNYAADIRERQVDIAEPGRFVPRSVLEIFDMLFSRLSHDAGSHSHSARSVSRQHSLIETAIRFCAILAVDTSNHIRFWDPSKPLAHTVAKNIEFSPHSSQLHYANFLKHISSSIVDSSRNHLGHLSDAEFSFCCQRVLESMKVLLGPKETISMSCVSIEEALFCALMQFCRMYDFVGQFSSFCIDHTTLLPFVATAISSSVPGMSFFLSASINIIILDENCTVTPKFLKAGLLFLPVFHPKLRVVKQDPSLYLKVSKCIFKILEKNNDLVMDLVLQSHCIQTLLAFVSSLNVSVEDVLLQNSAKMICSCFKLLCKTLKANVELMNSECVPLIIEYFLPNSRSETRDQCFLAILEILSECRAIVEVNKKKGFSNFQNLSVSERVIGILLSFLSKQEVSVSRSFSPKQPGYVFRCLADLCALDGSNHSIILHMIMENTVHRTNFYESLCTWQADDSSRIASLQLVAELAQLGNDISNVQTKYPFISKFATEVFEHVSFQKRIISELSGLDLASELALLFVRVIHLFTHTEGILDSVRQVFWPVIRGVLETAQSNIVAITKRMQSNGAVTCEEKVVLICTYVLLNMSMHMSRSPYAHQSGKDALPVLVLLFQEPSPCRVVALQVISTLSSEFEHNIDFMKMIIEVPDRKNSVLVKLVEVFCDNFLSTDERLACINIFTKFGSHREVSSVIYGTLMDSKAEKGSFQSLMPSLSSSFAPEPILDTLSIIHWAIIYKIEQGSLTDVIDMFYNATLVDSLAQLILPMESNVSLKAVEVLADMIDPQPFEMQLENHASSEKLVHLWPHFVSAVSTKASTSPQRLLKAVYKILISRISIFDCSCLTFQSEPYWSLNVDEIVQVIQAASSSANFYCVEQTCIVTWSLRRLIIVSGHLNGPEQNDDTISSICIDDIISFLTSTINMVTESARFSAAGSSVLYNYITEHAAFVLMHISSYLCRTGPAFSRNIVVILINVLLSCGLQITNFECYILACLHHVVLSSNKTTVVLAVDLEKSALWEKIVNRIKIFAQSSKEHQNELLMLLPGFSCSRIVLGLLDGLCDCCRRNPHFIEKYVRVPFDEISRFLISAVVEERLHAISILCKLAQMSYLVPEIIATFWRHASACHFVRSIQEILESGETVLERELACSFIYFSSQQPKERSDSWSEMSEHMYLIIFDANSSKGQASLSETIARCVFSPHRSISITALHCLLHFSSSIGRLTHQCSHLVKSAFLKDSTLFHCLSVVEHQLSSEMCAPILKEEFYQLTADQDQFVQYFAQKLLEFFFNMSFISDLVECFVDNRVVIFIVKSLEKSVNARNAETISLSHSSEPSDLESKMQTIQIILNLSKFGGDRMLFSINNAGVTPLLIDVVKDEATPADFMSLCLNALSLVAHIQDTQAFIQNDHAFLCRILFFLRINGGSRPVDSTFSILCLLRKISQNHGICNFLVTQSNDGDFFQSILQIFERDVEDNRTKLQALGVLSNIVSHDRVKSLIPSSSFLTAVFDVIRRQPSEEHLKLSLASFVHVCSNSPSNLSLVAALPGLIEDLCKLYLDPIVDRVIKDLASELLIVLSLSPSTLSSPGGLYLKYMSGKPEPLIHLLCRIVCFQVSSNGPSKLASLRLLYTVSMKSTNVSIISNYMIEECRTQTQSLPRTHSIFENLLIFLASTESSEREIAVNIVSGVCKINDWSNFFTFYRSHIEVTDCTRVLQPLDTSSFPNPLVPLLMHSAAQSPSQKEAQEAISALASLSDHEDYLCQISAVEPTFDTLITVLTSDHVEASLKSSHVFCNLAACASTQFALGSNHSIILSLAEILSQKGTIDDPCLRNLISCLHHLSTSKDSTQLLSLCQNRVLLHVVRQFGGSNSLDVSEILLNLCRAFSQHSDVLDRVVCAGSVVTLMTNMVSMNFEPKLVQTCFEILNILKSLPSVKSQLFDNVSFLELVCRSIFPKHNFLDAAILLLDLSACDEHRHRLFRCIKYVKDACKFLLRSNIQQQDGVPSSTALETCIGADILSNIAADFCRLEDFSIFFNQFPEHMWYQQNFIASAGTQAPNAQVQECCTRAIYSLCEGESEFFQNNQVACAMSCITQLYGLLENGATNLAKVNSARSLCAITALPQNADIRALLATKISPALLWHAPLLIIRQREPEDAVRFCLGLISQLVEDPGRGAALAMVPVEKLGGATRHIEWTLFRSLNVEEPDERLYAMSILAAICVEQPSEKYTPSSPDSLTGDVSRRVMKSNVGIGVFYQLMGQFRSSSRDEEKERICTIFDRFSASPEFEFQLRTHDPECSFILDCIQSQNPVISTLGCSIIKNACKFASSVTSLSRNEDLLSSMCNFIDCDDVRGCHVVECFVQLACSGNFSEIRIFDDANVLRSLVHLLGCSKRHVRELCCKLLLAISDSNDLGPRNSIMMRASPLSHLVALINDTPLIDSKIPMLLMSKFCSFPESQAFLHRDLLFVRETAMKVTHGRVTDLSSEKSQIALAALSCLAKLTRIFGAQDMKLESESKTFVQSILSCSQILSSAKECIEVPINSVFNESQSYAFINYSMEVFYNMSNIESSHRDMLDSSHQLLPLWCRFFDHIPAPGDDLQRSMPIHHLQYVLLILDNLIKSTTYPLEPFTICSMNSHFLRHLEVLLKRYCLAADDHSGSIAPLKVLSLNVLQLFAQDRQTRKVLIESERTGITTLVSFFCNYMSRKRSDLPNVDGVIESMLTIFFTLTMTAEHLPVLIQSISSSGRDVLLEYMRYAPQSHIKYLILKSLLNISRCSDPESLATLSGNGGIQHLTEWLFNHMFTKTLSTVEMHLSISTLFNLRHLMKADPSAKRFLLLPKESEFRDRIILASRTLHSEPAGASMRLICLKFISFLLYLCESEKNTKCHENICYKLLAPKFDQGSSFKSLSDIATLPDNDAVSSDIQSDISQLEFIDQVVLFRGEYAISDIDIPLMEGVSERLAQIEKAVCQHACLLLCTILRSLQPTISEQLALSDDGSKLHLPIVSHIREGSSLPLVVIGCNALASLAHTGFVQSFSDHVLITTLLWLLEQPTTVRLPPSVGDDIMTAILLFSNNPILIPYGPGLGSEWEKEPMSNGVFCWRHRTSGDTKWCDTGGDWIVGVLSRWFTICRHLHHKRSTLSIVEQITQLPASSVVASHVDSVLVAVAENPHFGLAFLSAQLDSTIGSPFPNCLNILHNILVSKRVRELVTAPTSFHNCTDILCRLIRSDESNSKPALSCLTLLCQDSDLACGLIPTDLIELVMDRTLRTARRAEFQKSNTDSLRLLQFIFRTHVRVSQMFEAMPQFFANILSNATSDHDVLRPHTSRLILSICCAEEPAVYELFMRKDICSFVSSLRDSQTEHCAAIAAQIACQLLMSNAISLQVEQRVRLFCTLQCGLFSRFECNWPMQQAPTSFKCAIEGADEENGVDFCCVSLPGGHYNIQSTQELILVHHITGFGSVYCVITVSKAATMHAVLLRYRDAISEYLMGLPKMSPGSHVDVEASMQSLASHVAEVSLSSSLGANFLIAVVTTERLVWSSMSSIKDCAHHILFLPSDVRSLASHFETAIGTARLFVVHRPSNRSFFVIGSEGFCRFMSDSQVADAISRLSVDSSNVSSGQSLRLSGEFLSVAKDLVNISTLGRVNGVSADDEQIPECSCVLLHLQLR